MLIPPWVKLAAIGVAIAGAFAAGLKVANWHRDSQALAIEQAAQKAADAVSGAAVAAVERIQLRNVTIRQQAETVVREVPVYRECRNDPRVLDSINAALSEPRRDPAGVSSTHPAN